MSENKNIVEVHGCIVCAKLFNVLAVYTPNGTLVGCKVTSPGGHCILDDLQPLVACDSHSAEEIDAAHKRWQSRNGKDPKNEQDDN